MPSSYSTNLKIELQATGENASTWGNITNTNLGTALEQAIVGYGNPNFATDANLTLTYTDTNAAQAARALVLNVTSGVSLTGTRELVVPTIQKQYIVQNNTTGSQSITVKTSGGTGITVPAGRKAHLYVDGTNVIFMDDFVDINGGAIDGTPIGANSAATGAFTTATVTTGNITTVNATTVNATTVDSTNLEVTNVKAKDGTAAFTIADATGKVTVSTELAVDNLNLSGNAITSTNTNGNIALTPNGTGEVDISKVDIDSGAIDGTTIGGSSAAAGTFTTLTANGNVTLGDATSDTITATGRFNSDVVPSADDTNDLGTTALQWAEAHVVEVFENGLNIVSQADIGTAPNEIPLNQYLGTMAFQDATAVTIDQAAIDSLTVSSGSTLNGGVVINELGADADTRIEGDTDANLFFVDASTDRIGVGTNSPLGRLDVVVASDRCRIRNSGGGEAVLLFQNSDTGTVDNGLYVGIASNEIGYLWNYENQPLVFGTNNAERLRIDSAGNLGLGVTPSATSGGYKNVQNGYAVMMGSSLDPAAYWNANATFNSGWKYISTGAATRYEQSSAHAWLTAPSGTAGDPITFTQAMTLDASGNLSIGTTSADGFGANYQTVTLEGAGTNTGGIYVSRTSDSSINMYVGTGNSTSFVRTSTNHPLAFFTNDTERARITSGGFSKFSNDGTYIGSSSSYHELRSTASDWITYIRNTNATPFGVQINHTTDSNGTGNNFLYCTATAGETLRATIRSNGGLANYQANNVDLSDVRTKKEINPASSMWDKIGALEIVTYKYNDQTHDDVNVGVIAQQVESVEPVWVDSDGFGEMPEDGVPIKTVYTKDIYFAAIKALQEAMTRIEELEAKVAALEAK